jgi:hypothetical protein
MALTVTTPYPTSGRARLQLVGAGTLEDRSVGLPWPAPDPDAPRLVVVPDPRPIRTAGPRRRVSPEVRRRRTVLAVAVLCILGLALPLGGTGGRSHAPGSASAGTLHPVEYTVQPGDSLWSIAARVDPSGDPRPLVAEMASQLGSDTVQPGERITVP